MQEEPKALPHQDAAPVPAASSTSGEWHLSLKIPTAFSVKTEEAIKTGRLKDVALKLCSLFPR